MIALQRGTVLRLPGSLGRTITTHAGFVWVTEQGNPHDVVLEPGQSFTFRRRGLALVEAFSDARISVKPS